MKSIRDFELWQELQEKPEWETLFNEEGERKNVNIPILAGGLDRIVVKTHCVVFCDIGCNGRDNSFMICGLKQNEKIGTPGDSRYTKELYIVSLDELPFYSAPFKITSVTRIAAGNGPLLALSLDEFKHLFRTSKYRFVTFKGYHEDKYEMSLSEIIGELILQRDEVKPV